MEPKDIKIRHVQYLKKFHAKHATSSMDLLMVIEDIFLKMLQKMKNFQFK